MDEPQVDEQDTGLPWLAVDLSLEMAFECESVVRKVSGLNEAQARELIEVALRHNFRLVHMLQLSIDRVHRLEEIIDELCQEPTDDEA